MKISVRVKPNSKHDRIEESGKNRFSVWVKARPADGKANAACIKVLSEYFNIPKSRVVLAKGQGSREKLFEIL